jgi:UDP-N-acetylglucosamine transferase subunit ALG13
MHTASFHRLLRAMDHIAAQGDEEVVMQVGATDYRPSAARWFTYAPASQMEALCKQARIVVSHAGAGSILTALRHGKPMVVMPRLRRYGEMIDDHQVELAEALLRANALLVAWEVGELDEKLSAASSFAPRLPKRSELVQAVRLALLRT